MTNKFFTTKTIPNVKNTLICLVSSIQIKAIHKKFTSLDATNKGYVSI